MRSLKRFMAGGRGEFVGTASLGAFSSGSPGKDGFTGYDTDSARGSLTPDDFFKGATCKAIAGNSIANTIYVELVEGVAQDYIRSVDLPFLGEFLTADADGFDNNGGAGPTIWTWVDGVGIVYTGTVTFRG